MKKFNAILGLAAMLGGLLLSSPAVAYQATSAATQATPATPPMTPEQKKAARAEKKAAKAAEKNAAPASSTAPAAAPAPATMAAPAPSGMGTPTTAKASKSTMAKPVAATATPAQIADAKAKGMVWVNKSTKVYHKSDDRYYGATKTGEFMSEADAQKAGAHLAK